MPWVNVPDSVPYLIEAQARDHDRDKSLKLRNLIQQLPYPQSWKSNSLNKSSDLSQLPVAAINRLMLAEEPSGRSSAKSHLRHMTD